MKGFVELDFALRVHLNSMAAVEDVVVHDVNEKVQERSDGDDSRSSINFSFPFETETFGRSSS